MKKKNRKSNYLENTNTRKLQSLLPNILSKYNTTWPHEQAIFFFHILIQNRKKKKKTEFIVYILRARILVFSFS